MAWCAKLFSALRRLVEALVCKLGDRIGGEPRRSDHDTAMQTCTVQATVLCSPHFPSSTGTRCVARYCAARTYDLCNDVTVHKRSTKGIFVNLL